jgi:hypothetical protein
MTKIPMTEIFLLSPPGEREEVRGVLVNWILENWNLVGAWDLEIGI